MINVANERGKMGALQNRLDFTIAYTENEIESIQASEATLRDADIAAEVTEFSRGQILMQSSKAMLVQANVGSVSPCPCYKRRLKRRIIAMYSTL
ncbi:MAG: flagellin [Candidatus Latescibacterota bacterium]|nr:flagellin [Candidatus Latescibacterota bacterium]